MTTKRIDQLPEASAPQGTDLLALYQSDGTKKVPLGSIQATGPAGKDGVSPTVEVSKSGTQTTITITDAKGAHTAIIEDGAPGKDGGKGADGEDGFSPTVDVKKVGKTTTVTITDKEGPHVTTIEDGADGEGGGGGGGAYTLPVASAETLGGVKAKAKTEAETVEVAVDEEGKLFVPAASGEGGGGGYTLPVAGKSALGGVKWSPLQKSPVASMAETIAALVSVPGIIADSGSILVPVVGSNLGADSGNKWPIGAVTGNGEKTDEDTIPVHNDETGKLWVKPSGEGGGYTLPTASGDTLGGVKGPEKTDAETQQVHVDGDGNMWVPAASGGGGGTSGVSLYIEDVGNNPALANVDFGKYKAGDVVLVVQDMAVSE